MNCQDITRIANSGSFARLSEAERNAAATHALTCRHCAPVWAVHARMAEVRIPPMPAELALRCRTLVAAPVQSGGRYTWRRLTLIGGVMAVVAAAGMLALNWNSTVTPEPASASVAEVPVEPVAPMTTPPSPPPVIRDVDAPPPAPIAAASEKPPVPLPLVPAPVNDRMRIQVLSDLALQKLVERHPELVEGPPFEGMFHAAIALFEDGRVYTSMVRLASDRDTRAEVRRSVPEDSGSQFGTSFRKDTRLPDGRALRANVSGWVAILGDNYDVSRSSLRVLQAMGDKYRNLMLPSAGGIFNRLTLFMTEDGRIEREHVERMGPSTGRMLVASDTNDVADMAESIAKPLGLDVSRIGLLGVTGLQEGSVVMITDANGNSRPDDQSRVLVVMYAWPRRAEETGPRWGQGSPFARSQRPDVDPAAALAIVEREIPDAFRIKDPAAGSPTVVLTARGELIKAGRVPGKPGEPLEKTIRDELAPGVGQLTSFNNVRVRNAQGETADITFTWEAPEAPKPGN